MDQDFMSKVEELRFQQIKVLTDGFVSLQDIMGDESSIVQAARVSYGEGTKPVLKDIELIRYLMEQRHTTPLEMVELKFLIRMPMDAWRQHIRTRTANVNEYSTRYSKAIDSRETTSEWRGQATVNKQGSKGLISDEWPEGYSVEGIDVFGETHFIVNDNREDIKQNVAGILFHLPPTPSEYLSQREIIHHELDDTLYKERLLFGVAREQARKDLPLSTYTEAYWKIDLHNLLHYLGLRMDSHAQLEIRLFANAIGSIVEKLYPNVWEAFLDFKLNAMSLGADEIELIATGKLPKYWSKRRATEFIKKLGRIGLTSHFMDKYPEINLGFMGE